MSNKKYNELWASAFQEAELFLKPSEVSGRFDDKDPSKAFKYYHSCIVIYQKIQEAYDMLVHPQKRVLAKQLLSVVSLELELAKLHLLSLAIPKTFYETELKQFAKLVDDLDIPGSECLAADFKAAFQLKTADVDHSTIQQYVDFENAPIVLPSTSLDVKPATPVSGASQPTTTLKEKRPSDREAAVRIQKVYRGFKDRKYARAFRHEEQVRLGMSKPAVSASASQLAELSQIKTRRQQLQKQYEREYVDAKASEHSRVYDVEMPSFKLALSSSFHEWYLGIKTAKGSLPDMPPKAEFLKHGFSFVEYSKSLEAPVEAVDPKDKGKGKKPAPKAKAKEAAAPVVPETLPSHLTKLKDLIQEYTQTWKKRDETENFHQGPDIDLLKHDLQAAMELQVKEEAYDAMCEELRSAKSEVDGIKLPKKGKEKSEKTGKGVKKADTAKMTPEDLAAGLKSLISSGVIRQASNTETIDSFGSNQAYVWKTGFEKWSNAGRFDLVLQELVSLPVQNHGNLFEDAQLPVSILVTGDLSQSKIVSYLASQTGATVYDLSPKNLAKVQSDPAQVMAMAFKCAKAAPPAIIALQDVETICAKKSTPIGTVDPKTLKKDLGKLIKGLKQTDGVIVVGMTNKPFETEPATLAGAFEVTVWKPWPEYADRYKAIKGKIPSDNIASIVAAMATDANAAIVNDLTERFLNAGKILEGKTITEVNALKLKEKIDSEGWLTKLAPSADFQ